MYSLEKKKGGQGDTMMTTQGQQFLSVPESNKPKETFRSGNLGYSAVLDQSFQSYLQSGLSHIKDTIYVQGCTNS